jgi:hypothetical protein
VSGVSLNTNRPSVHLRADPAVRVPFDDNFSASHLAAHVPASRSVNSHFAAGHVGTYPMDTSEITFEIHAFVTCIARDIEHFFQGNIAVPMENFKTFDFTYRLIAGPIWCEPLDFDWNCGFSPVCQPDRHKVEFPVEYLSWRRRK